MARKVCNNKVTFYAQGEELQMRLSDKELMQLRNYSDWRKGDNWQSKTHGTIKNFSVFALFDYAFKSRSKQGRFYATFNYHKFDFMLWDLNS